MDHIVLTLLRHVVFTSYNIQGGLKKLAHFLYALTSYDLTSSNINRFSNLFHCLDPNNICNNKLERLSQWFGVQALYLLGLDLIFLTGHSV